MANDSANEKRQAHELIERLESSQIATALHFLEFMLLDPASLAIATAPVDDELLTAYRGIATVNKRNRKMAGNRVLPEWSGR